MTNSLLKHFGHYRVLSVTESTLYYRQGGGTPQAGDVVSIPGAEWALMREGAFCWAIEKDERYGAQFAADQLEELVAP